MALVGALGAGCSLSLDEPRPFRVDSVSSDATAFDEGSPAVDAGPALDAAADAAREALDAATDAEEGRDAAPDRGLVPDAGPRVDAAPDARVIEDASPPPEDATPPPPDASPVDAAPIDALPPDACVPEVEVCNGVDDDCDGVVDESDPQECEACAVDGALGVCAIGATSCVEGALRCLSHLPGAEVYFLCDQLDADCDGRMDEADESPRPPSALELRVRDRCGPPEHVQPAVQPGDCVGSPGRVGCAPGHACEPPACLAACGEQHAVESAGCSESCVVGDAAARSRCVGACRVGAELRLSSCRVDCGEAGGIASRWLCAPTPNGAPTCTAVDCPEGTRPSGRECVPRVEICNNGRDDDGDGLVDGALDQSVPCMVRFEPVVEPFQMGVCDNPFQAGCEDTIPVSAGWRPTRSGRCVGASCPHLVTTDYAFEIDREEVSIRAYAECVASGCCLPPTGRTFGRAVAAMQDGAAPPERPAAENRCAEPVDELDPRTVALLPDLPVTGVTWCQARDFCHWAGKRLATDFEWERAAMGAARAPYPWGDAQPAACREDQCCRGAEFHAAPPGVCDGGLPLCRADVDPSRAHAACGAIYGFEEAGCAPVPGPAPTWAGRDADSDRGVRNLTGNVSEWVYDWTPFDLTGRARHNPAGPACDADVRFPGKRNTRGHAFTAPGSGLPIVLPVGIFPQTRSPAIGFRCARTVTPEENSTCNPRTPEVPAVCAPGTDLRIGQAPPDRRPACAAPDLQNVQAGDDRFCPQANPRRGSGECVDGLANLCASDRQLSPGAFLVSRMRLFPGQVENADMTNLVNTIVDASLAPRGGSTLVALDLPSEFSMMNREWTATLGSAQINANGCLSWLGEEDGGICRPSERLSFTLRTVEGQRGPRPVCNATGRGRMWIRSSPVNLPFSGLGLRVEYLAAADLLTGTIVLVLNMNDIADTKFGPEPSAPGALLDAFGLEAINLCGLVLPFIDNDTCAASPLNFPGCDSNVCTDPGLCTGFVLPWEFEAVRAQRANVPGLAACQ